MLMRTARRGSPFVTAIHNLPPLFFAAIASMRGSWIYEEHGAHAVVISQRRPHSLAAASCHLPTRSSPLSFAEMS
jgi:hypothetical protein